MTKQEQIQKLYYVNPSATTTELAEQVGCSNRTARYALESIKSNSAFSPAKILLFDLETSPMEVYSWGLWKQLIQPQQVMKDWAVLSWSAKWLFSETTMGMVVSPEEAKDREDKDIMEKLWGLMNEADIIIAHNANKFDVKRMNARFIQNGLLPPSPYRVIDTLASIKRVFGFSSNKMDYVNELLGLTMKLAHEGFDMWKKAVNGTSEESFAALGNMLEYNKVDVLALEELYMMIRPWIKSHPNVNLYQDWKEEDDQIHCVNCGSDNITWNGKYYTPSGRFASFRCNSCGAMGRSRYSDITLAERKTLGIAVAN
jgi:hypothetical protein